MTMPTRRWLRDESKTTCAYVMATAGARRRGCLLATEIALDCDRCLTIGRQEGEKLAALPTKAPRTTMCKASANFPLPRTAHESAMAAAQKDQGSWVFRKKNDTVTACWSLALR